MRRLNRCSLLLLLLGAGCNRFGEFDIDVEPIELGVAVRLEAVTFDYQRERLYIVGSGGLVVDDLGNRWELPATLRDVIDVEGDYNDESLAPRLIVVGSGGFVA